MAQSRSYMVDRIEFESSGVLCRGLLMRPLGVGPFPCVVMAPGFGMTYRAGLVSIARGIARSGTAVLLFDYRHFGESDGHLRQLLSISKQVADWGSAIVYARSHSKIDATQIYCWGFSLGAGHALTAASQDPAVRGLIAVAPMFDGLSSALAAASQWSARTLLTLGYRVVVDCFRWLVRAKPLTAPVAAKPGTLGLLTSEDALAGYQALVPYGFDYGVSARIALTFWRYRPGRLLKMWRRPALIIGATADQINPIGPTEKYVALSPTVYYMTLDCEHLEALMSPCRERLINQTVAFVLADLRDEQAAPIETPAHV
jgi:pimeloyl-ACP methyl ester carboxylesterase